MSDLALEDLLRREAPQVLAALVRRYGNFHLAEDATQEALLAAATTWPDSGPPEHPRGWLLRVGQRRLIDMLRAEATRSAREEHYLASSPEPLPASDRDDSLELLFLCCHEGLSDASAVVLTLRAVGGLTTDEIARAFLTSPATVGQRISRAKATISASREGLGGGEMTARVDRVMTVLYLIFNEGYSASAGADLGRVDVAAEAIRVARMLHAALPDAAEPAGLLALMLLHHARRDARELGGEPVPLAEQDRARWDRRLIHEGTALLTATMPRGPLGRYQVLAAISALHDEAPTDAATDWVQILALYDLLRLLDPSPMVLVARAVAVGRVLGPQAGIDAVDAAAQDPRLRRHHRPIAVKAHLAAELGDLPLAAELFGRAAALTRSIPERRYLTRRARELGA